MHSFVRPVSLCTWLFMILSVSPFATAAGTPLRDASTQGANANVAVSEVRVSLVADPTWVPKGQTVTLTGKVAHARGRTLVTIYQKVVGRTWTKEVAKRTNRRGKFQHREDVKAGDRWYRACAKGQCSQKVLVRMGKPPKQATSLSISSVSATAVDAGDPFTVEGVASPNLVGQTVQIESFDAAADNWGAAGSAVVGGDSSWVGTTAVTTAGASVPLRARFLGTRELLPSQASADAITVFGWYYFSDGTPQAVDGMDDGATSINGTTYPNTISFSSMNGSGPGSYTFEYDLSRDCTTFVSTIGMTDTSSTDARYSSRIYADSVELWAQASIGIGYSYPVSLDVTNALRIRFAMSRDTWANGRLAFGDARVRCAF